MFAILCPDTPVARQLIFPGGAGRIVKKVRAPKFYLGLLEIMCWEPHGLQFFKVSVNPWQHLFISPTFKV